MPDSGPKPSVFAFNSFSELLSAWIDWLKTKNVRYSLRWVAKRLELGSHAHLQRLISGHKQPSDVLLRRIAAMMNLTVDEFSFVRGLAELARARNLEDRAYALDKVESQRQAAPDVMLQLDAFEVIAHWYHLTIFEMTVWKDFSESPEWIADQLDGVTPEMVRDSLQRLEKLGLIHRDESGKLVRSIDKFNTPNNLPSSIIRHFHRQILEKSNQALDAVAVNQRFFFSHTMPLDSTKLEQAAELLIEFRSRFHKLLEGGTFDSVYHLGLQLVPLTKVERQMKGND